MDLASRCIIKKIRYYGTGRWAPKWEDSPVEIELSNVKIHYY